MVPELLSEEEQRLWSTTTDDVIRGLLMSLSVARRQAHAEIASQGEVARAREAYQVDGSVEIDDVALISTVDDPKGAWVQAWVWIED